jgi:hypothetical protein
MPWVLPRRLAANEVFLLLPAGSVCHGVPSHLVAIHEALLFTVLCRLLEGRGHVMGPLSRRLAVRGICLMPGDVDGTSSSPRCTRSLSLDARGQNRIVHLVAIHEGHEVFA